MDPETGPLAEGSVLPAGTDPLAPSTHDSEPAHAPDSRSATQVLKEHETEAKGVGLTAALLALFLFIRVLAVSGWDWETAADLADSFNFDDAVPIVFGTLFELPIVTGVIAALLLPIALFRIYVVRNDASVEAILKNGFIVVSLLATMYVLFRSFGLWWPIVVSLLLTGALVVAFHVWSSGKAHIFLGRLGKHTGLLLLGSLLVLALLVDTPWMPREEITLKDRVVYGHVLEASPGFLKVITDDKEVLYFTDAEVERRKAVGG